MELTSFGKRLRYGTRFNSDCTRWTGWFLFRRSDFATPRACGDGLREVLDCSPVLDGGPGRIYSWRPSVRRVGDRILVKQDAGYDI